MRPLLILLFFGILSQGIAQTSPPQKPIPSTSTTVDKAALNKEQPVKPPPMTEQELKVIRNLSGLSTERLLQLLQVYQKLKHEAMVQIIAQQLLKHNPNQSEALQALDSLKSNEVPRPPNYIELLVKMLNAGRKVDDPDAIAIEAHRLADSGQAAQAVKLLEKLQELNYPSGDFPYLEDIASAYQDAGDLDKAEKAYRTVAKDPLLTPEARNEVERQIEDIAMERRITALNKNAEARPQETLAEAEKLVKEHPNDQQALAFYLDALNEAGRYKDAVAKLLELKAQAPQGHFAYQDTLAYAYYGAKDFDKAAAAFREVRDDTAFTKEIRADAVEMLADIADEQKVDPSHRAKPQTTHGRAKVILDALATTYPNNEHVSELRSKWLSPSGHSKKARHKVKDTDEDDDNEGSSDFDKQSKLAESYEQHKQFGRAREVFEKILASPHYNQEEKKDAKEELRTIHQDELIEEGDKAIKNAHLRRAKEIGAELSKSAPNDKDVKIYLAELKLALRHPQEAYNELSAIKQKDYANAPFPGQESLADSLNHLGRWEEAADAYKVLTDQPSKYEADDVFDASLEQRNLLPYYRNILKFDVNFVDEEQGKAYREEFLAGTEWWQNWRIVVTARNDDIDLKHVNILIPQHSDRAEAQVALQHRFDGGYFAEASVGGAESNALYGVRVGKLAEEGIGWSLGFLGNARAVDYSLPLEVLNAREDRIQFATSGQFNERVRFDLESFVHWISVDRERFGNGWGVNGNLDLVLQAETNTKAEITLSYVGEYSHFNPVNQVPSSVLAQINPQEFRSIPPAQINEDIFNDLISREVDRHGVQLAIHKHLYHNFDLFAEGEGYFEFADKSWNYTFAGGVDYWFNAHSRFFSEARYDSDGRGPENGGHGYFEATVGLQITF